MIRFRILPEADGSFTVYEEREGVARRWERPFSTREYARQTAAASTSVVLDWTQRGAVLDGVGRSSVQDATD